MRLLLAIMIAFKKYGIADEHVLTVRILIKILIIAIHIYNELDLSTHRELQNRLKEFEEQYK